MYGRTALYGLVRSGQCEPLPSHQCFNILSSVLTPLCFTPVYSTLQQEDLSQEPRNMAENLRNILERLGVNMSQDKVREVERTTPLDHEGRIESESRVQEQHQEDSGHHDQEVTQEVENVPQVGVNEQGEVHDPKEVSETETEVQAKHEPDPQLEPLC